MDITNTVKMTTEEKTALHKLYDYLGHNTDAEIVSEDIMFGYLSETIDGEGDEYLWYLDPFTEAAINITSGKIIDDPNEIAERFGL